MSTPPTFSRSELAENTIYPEGAVEQELEGKVYVLTSIRRDGVVVRTEVIKSDNSIFNEAAVDALRRTSFEPGTQEGEPIDFRIVITIHFKLD